MTWSSKFTTLKGFIILKTVKDKFTVLFSGFAHIEGMKVHQTALPSQPVLATEIRTLCGFHYY